MILVVDDQPDVCRVVQLLLASAGCTADCVHGGAAALKVLETIVPDCVVLDNHMPDVDGLEVLRAIRARFGDRVPVVMFSAGTDDRRRREAMAAGAADWISKLDVDALVERVTALSRRQVVNA